VNRWSKVFLIALRIAVGWHFLYEGLWKIDSDTGAPVYAPSWYTLQSSVARLRDYYERTDPLQMQPALARADAWYDEIVKALKSRNRALSEDQKGRLAELRDKVKLAAAGAVRGSVRHGEVVNFDWQLVRDEVLKLTPPPASERFTAMPFLQASVGPFRPVFRSLVRDVDGIDRLAPPAAHHAVEERYEEILHHYEDVGRPFTGDQQRRLAEARDAIKRALAATLSDGAYRTRLADYAAMRRRVAADASLANAPFSRERLAADRTKLDTIEGELLALTDEAVAELDVQSQTIATAAQLGTGPLRQPGDPAGWINWTMRWGLTAIGACLLLGLFTPVAGLAAAGMMAMFYLASPPWPGLPAATLGGHYLYVDRNLVELIAAGVIATTGSGRWAGLDAFIGRRGGRAARRTDPELACVGQTTTSLERS